MSKRSDSRGYRPWVKVRLQDTADAYQVVKILDYWQGLRTAALHLTRAVILYYALTQGDTEPLRRYFPLLANALGNGNGGLLRPPQVERKATVETKSRSEDEDKADLIDSLF